MQTYLATLHTATRSQGSVTTHLFVCIQWPFPRWVACPYAYHVARKSDSLVINLWSDPDKKRWNVLSLLAAQNLGKQHNQNRVQAIKSDVEIGWWCDGCTKDIGSTFTLRNPVSTPQSSPVTEHPSSIGSLLNFSLSPHSSNTRFNDCNHPPSPNVQDLSERSAASFNEPVSDLEMKILVPDDERAEPEQQRFEVVIRAS